MSDDRLELFYFGMTNPLEEGEERLRACFEVLDCAAGGFRPEKIWVGEKASEFTVANALSVALQLRPRKLVTLHFTHRAFPSMRSKFTFIPDGPPGFWFWAQVPMTAFGGAAPAGDGAARDFTNLIRDLSQVVPPEYGFAHPQPDFRFVSDPARSDPTVKKEVRDVYWLNVYGAGMTRRLRKRLTNLSAVRTEPLPCGGLLWLAYEDPAQFLAESSRVAQARNYCQLMPESSFDSILAKMLSRSPQLAVSPVGLDPDLAEVVRVVLAFAEPGARAELAVRLEALRSAPLTEVVGAAHEAGSDVGDQTGAIREYVDIYAEELAMLVHHRVPGALSANPDVLPQVDAAIWHQFPPEKLTVDDRSRVIRAAGAFLGMMLVRHGKGEWVPRRDLYETEVRTAAGRFLPFLRAKNWYESRDSVLCRSLTRFYREAVR